MKMEVKLEWYDNGYGDVQLLLNTPMMYIIIGQVVEEDHYYKASIMSWKDGNHKSKIRDWHKIGVYSTCEQAMTVTMAVAIPAIEKGFQS